MIQFSFLLKEFKGVISILVYFILGILLVSFILPLIDALTGLVKSGVKGIWNFAPIDLDVPNGVIVENVNLTESLFTLSYLMKEHE